MIAPCVRGQLIPFFRPASGSRAVANLEYSLTGRQGGAEIGVRKELRFLFLDTP